MLGFIRKNIQNPYMQGILGLVVIVLVFFFGWGMRSGGTPPIATVNGDAISYEQYQKTYESMLNELQQKFKDDLTPSKLKELDLKKLALDKLIDQTLLLQEADMLNLGVTDEDIRRDIESVEFFKEGGKFNKRRYLMVLESNRLTPKEFEVSRRQELLLFMVKNAIMANAQVPEEEIHKEFEEMNTKLEVDFAAFRESSFEADVQAVDQELKDFYEAEKEAFRVPEKLSAKYILFTPEAFLDSVTVTESEIQQEFNWRADEFAVKEAVHARHILFRLPPGAKPEDEQAIKAKAEEVRAKIVDGNNFAELAKQHSEDPGSKTNGGDLGFFERGKMVPEFEEAAFALKPKTVSEPVKTSFGYHLIYVEERREAQESKLEDVRGQIEAEIKNRKALEEAYYAAKNVWMDLEDGVETWEKLAATHTVEKTQAIEKGGIAAGTAKPKEFTNALFGLTPEDKGALIETDKGTYLLGVDVSTPSTIPPLEEVKDKVEAKYRSVTAKSIAQKKANDFLAEARSTNWDDAIKSFGLESQSSGKFAKKGGAIPKIGWAPEFKEKIQALKDVGDIVDEPHESNNAYYVVKLTGVTPADESLFEKQKEQIKGNLLRKAQEDYFKQHMEDLREKADLEIEKRYL